MTLRPALFTAFLGLMLPAGAQACEGLTSHFDLCSEGTPWADGRWVNGGDSATLYLGKIGFDGFEEYLGSDVPGSIKRQLASVRTFWAEDAPVVPHLSDSFTTTDLTIVRSIDTYTFPKSPPELRVTMIGKGKRARIMMLISAPADVDPAEIERLSRAYAALVRPRAETQDN